MLPLELHLQYGFGVLDSGFIAISTPPYFCTSLLSYGRDPTERRRVGMRTLFYVPDSP
jgi:hypothetical protein